jgi:hypothetical protein
VGKLCLLGPLLHLRGPNRLTTDVVGFKAGGHPYAPLYPHAPSAALSLLHSLNLDKKGREKVRQREREREKEIGSRNTEIVKVLPFLPP